MPQSFPVLRSLVCALLLFVAVTASADDWPEITDTQRSLSSVPFAPGATAVILDEAAHLRFLRFPTEASSRLEVWVRMKILTEEGMDFAEISIPHSRVLRLGEFEGRTVLPNGQVVPLGDDDVFVERQSRSRRSYVTKAAFPAVEVGAIIDYRYVFFWDTFLYLDPWLFHGDLPKLRSEITYIKPDNLAVRVWGKETGAESIQSRQNPGPHGLELSLWMENLPALPNEPFGFPAEDLASRFMVVPTSVTSSGVEVELLESWESVCQIFEDQVYEDFEKGSRSVKRLARELTAGAKTDREKAKALYTWVRDEIQTLDIPGAWLAMERADDVVEERRGNMADQALLLRRMLDAVKIDSRPTWVGHRDDGRIDPTVPNPSWFRGTVLRAEIGSDQVYLDPSDPTLAFGALGPGHEGSIAVACSRKDPEVLTLGSSPAEANRRHASIDLELDADGRLTGKGELVYSGQAAWMQLGTVAEDELADTWKERLEARFEGFEIAAPEVDEDVDGQRFTVRFDLAQREDDVLGDEASLRPSVPLAATQPFALPPAQRRGPVQLRHASLDEAKVTVRWAEGWRLETTPKAVEHGSDAGRFQISTSIDTEARTLRFERRFSRHHIDYLGDEAYTALRTLHDTAQATDAQSLVWVHE